MSNQLSIQKYRAVVNPSEVFEFVAGNEVSSNPHIVFFVNDFNTPDSLASENKILSSELTFKISDSDELKVDKDYQTSSIKISLNGEVVSKTFYEVISDKLKSQIDNTSWSKLVIDCLKNSVNSLDELKTFFPVKTVQSSPKDLNTLIAEASEGLTKEESNKLVKMRETSQKIKNMEKEVGSYQNQKKDKEELKKNKEKLDRDVKALEDKLSSVNMLIESKDRLSSELEKFKSITSDSSIHQKVEKIKENRSQSLSSSLKTMRKAGGVNMETEEKEGSLLVAKWMIGLVVFQLVLSLLFFIISFQLIQLLIGVFSGIVILILMLLVNVSRYSYQYKSNFNPEISNIPVKQTVLVSNPDEDKLILNNAWSKALQGEFDMVNSTIKSRLGDKSLDEIKVEKDKLEEEQKKLDTQISEGEGKSLNTEEYYKKRRELDILKIEKENIEFGLEGKIKKEIEDQISEISLGSEVKTESSIEPNLPVIIVNCKFINEITDFINNLKQTRQVLEINY